MVIHARRRQLGADSGLIFARRTLRVVLLLALLLVEVVALTARYDFNLPAFRESGDWIARTLSYASALLRILTVSAAVFLLMLMPRLKAYWRELLLSQGRRWRLWLVLHLLSAGGFYACTAGLFPPSGEVLAPGASWLAAWLSLGAALFASWLLALGGADFWRQLASREAVPLGVGLLAGLLGWWGGQVSEDLWLPLSDLTLRLSHGLLDLFFREIVYDPAGRILGTPEFYVNIAPQCSGIEGIALVTVFTAIYIWLFRAELVFPAVLWLFPLGIAAIFGANVLRIVLLIALGDGVSPDIAVNGFHSQAGWITFTLIALALIALSRRVRLFGRVPGAESATDEPAGGHAAALLLPLMVLMGTAMASSAFSAGFEWLYPLKILAGAAALMLFLDHYRSLDWGFSWHSVALGVAVFAAWMLLEPVPFDLGVAPPRELLGLPAWAASLWLWFRIVGSVLVVPLAEELAFRGYLVRKLVAGDYETVPFDRFTWFSFLGSSLIFGLLHGRWLAGTLAGMAFAVALYRRGRIGDALIAHVTANALIAATVLGWGQWGLWS